MLIAKPSYVTYCFIIFLLSGSTCYQTSAQQYSYSEKHLGKVQYANKVLQDALLNNDSLQIAEAYYLLGKTELNAGNYLTSQIWLFKSIRIMESYGDSFKLGRLYLRLQEKEYRQGHYDQALKYLKTALGIFQRVKSDVGLQRAYSSLGNFYGDVGKDNSISKQYNPKYNYDSAFYFYNKAELYSKKLNDTLGLADIHLALGNLYVNQKNPKAIPYIKSALITFLNKNKQSEETNGILFLAEAHMAFNQYKEAYALILQAEQIYYKDLLNENHTKRHLEKSYVNYFQATNNWKQAFIHLENLYALDRMELIADQEGAISRLNVEYETQKKEARLQKQQKELELTAETTFIQQKFLYTFAALLGITVILSFVFYRLYRKNQRMSNRNAILIKEQNHRVKNNLQVVSSLLSLQSNRLSDSTARQAVEESMLRIEAMAILHRKLYDDKDLAVINLSEFIMELTEVILKTFGFGYIQPTYTFVPIKLSADEALSIGLIINELVTNACKYAFPTNNTPTLAMTDLLEKDELVITVTDNGPGFTDAFDSKTKLSKTFGMKLIQMQIKQIYGTYQFKHINGQGTKFTMKFKPYFLK